MTGKVIKPEDFRVFTFENGQGFVAEERAARRDWIIKCSTCRFENGTAVCEKRKKDHKVSLSHQYNPDNHCFEWKPDQKKIFQNMKMRK